MTDLQIEDATEIVTKASPRSVYETVTHLVELLRERTLKLFAVIDQGAEARAVGLELRDTVLVVFGNPAAGTSVMAAVPLAALDLPLKVLVWDNDGQTLVSYLRPSALARRHQVPAELATELAGIDPLTDALVSP